jgi:hypothetical protein
MRAARTGVVCVDRLGTPSFASRPRFDVLSQPEPDSAPAQIHYRLREVLVAPEVGAHTVVMGQPENLRDLCGSDEVFGPHPRVHTGSLRKLTNQGAER